MQAIRTHLAVEAIIMAAVSLLLVSCERGDPLAPAGAPVEDGKAMTIERQTGDTPPALLASVAHGGEILTFWPYTGASFDGTPVDPINLVFVGQADPRQIRAALLALDGDRTAFGFPDAPPFNAVWGDAVGGDVQTACVPDGHGWVGSVVQLTLGDFGPLRFHLRLFRTGRQLGGGCWTLGGAHFEMQIPGTTSHQVLSWELAEQLVVADLLRTGLLDPAAPALPTGPINAAPAFREIPAEIYNLLPPELAALTGGPAQPVAEAVPLPSDGRGTILDLAGAAPVSPGSWTASATIDFAQLVPRPFCAEGPGDWLYVTGPVVFTTTTRILPGGGYRVHADYSGELVAVPMDLAGGEPLPVGEPFVARVAGSQLGHLGDRTSRIRSMDRTLTREADGPQMEVVHREIPQAGAKHYHRLTRCLDD